MLAALLTALASLPLTGGRAEPGWIAIENVNVITMEPEGEHVLPGRTVLIEGERIRAVGPYGTLAVPEGAHRIAGVDRWLIPGLVDMHAHLLSDDRIDGAFAPTELDVFLAEGVTTARIPIGHAELLTLRRRVEARELRGPELFVGSPQLAGRAFGRRFNGTVTRTPEEARAAVLAAHDAGYDFVKLTFWITPEVFGAAVETAAELGMPVVGHVGPAVGLERALAAGMQIEHLDQFLEALLPPDVPNEAGVSGLGVWKPENWSSLEMVDAAAIPALARRVAQAGVWNTPTLSFLGSSFGTGRSDEELRSGFEWRMVSDEVRADLLRGRERFWAAPPPAALRARYVELRNEVTRALFEAGAPLMAGSDAPEWLLLYGFALHRELEALVAAGLPPWDALAAATRVPCTWLGVDDDLGTIAVGKRADLVLLGADPLAEIANTKRIDGLLVRGEWLDRGALDGLLYGAAGRLSRAPLRAPETR